jgi:hypothetical protein
MNVPRLFRLGFFACLLFGFGSMNCHAQCKELAAEAKVVKATDGSDMASIEVDIKNQNSSHFKLSLFGPERKNELDVQKTTFTNLSKGKYLIVIVSKREDDNYCPKSITVTIN